MTYKWTSKDKTAILLSVTMIILMLVALYIGNNIIVNINEVNEGLDRTTKIITACNACQEPVAEEDKEEVPAPGTATGDQITDQLDEEPESADSSTDDTTRPVPGTN